MLTAEDVHVTIESGRCSTHVCLLGESSSDYLHLFADGTLTRCEKDDGVPDSLKWQHATTSNTQRKADPTVVCQAVKSVDRAWYPSNEDGKSEDETCPKIGHLDRIKPLEFERCIRPDCTEPRKCRALYMRPVVRDADCLELLCSCTWASRVLILQVSRCP